MNRNPKKINGMSMRTRTKTSADVVPYRGLNVRNIKIPKTITPDINVK